MKKKWFVLLFVLFVIVFLLLVWKVVKAENHVNASTVSRFDFGQKYSRFSVEYNVDTKEIRKYPFEIKKEKELLIHYKNNSTSKHTKIIVYKKSNELVHSFKLDKVDQGIEKLKLTPNEYIIEIVIPSNSKGVTTVNWD